MLLALSGGQKLGIAAVASVFIAFALLSSFVLPRRNADFPGRGGLRLFVVATLVLFVAMLAAVAVFAREEEEEGGEHGAVPAETETGATEPPETRGESETEPAGDPGAGAEVFESAGCGGCHTLAAAGSSGTVGPNLDGASPPFDLVVERVTNGMGAMPSFEDQLSEQQITDVAAYVVDATSR